MPKIIILPHDEICPDGAQFDAEAGISVLDAALEHGVAIDHACEKSCACTTCHIYVREGYDSLTPPNDNEDDYLDKAWGLDPESRLGCQAIVADEDLVIEIPKYTVNLVSEHH